MDELEKQEAQWHCDNFCHQGRRLNDRKTSISFNISEHEKISFEEPEPLALRQKVSNVDESHH